MNQIIEKDLNEIISVRYIDWTKLYGKTVLITGANGMLPSYMVETIVYLNRVYRAHIRILALVRNITKAHKCFPDYSENDGLLLFEQDVCVPFNYSGPIHYIIHAASQAAPLFYGKDPVGTISANVVGTKNMLEVAREKNIEKFLYFSSGAVYGDHSNDKTFISEASYNAINTLEVKSCYPISKQMGENLCIAYGHQYGVKTSIVRIVHTLGPHIQLNDGRAFSDFTKAIVENHDIVLKSDGSATRPFLYITDATCAFFKILLDGGLGQAYNVGADLNNEISMRDLAQMLVSMYPEKKLKVIFDIDEKDMTYSKMRSPQQQARFDYSLLKSLGWEQTISVKEAFRRTINSILLIN